MFNCFKKKKSEVNTTNLEEVNTTNIEEPNVTKMTFEEFDESVRKLCKNFREKALEYPKVLRTDWYDLYASKNLGFPYITHYFYSNDNTKAYDRYFKQYTNFIEGLPTINQKIEDNIKAYNEFRENPSHFIKLTPNLFNGSPFMVYALDMCFNDINVVMTTVGDGRPLERRTYNMLDYKIEHMSEEEFKNNFIITAISSLSNTDVIKALDFRRQLIDEFTKERDSKKL